MTSRSGETLAGAAGSRDAGGGTGARVVHEAAHRVTAPLLRVGVFCAGLVGLDILRSVSEKKIPRSKRSIALTAAAGGFFVLAVALIALMLALQSGSVELPLLTAFVGLAFVFLARRSRRSDAGIVLKDLNIPLAGLVRSANPYERILLIGGAAGIAVGAIAGYSGATANADSGSSNRLLMALGGMQYFDPEAGSEYTGWIIFGVASAIIGVALLTVFVSIRAGRPPRAA